MPSPNPLAGLHIAIRHHLSGVIIAWQRRVLLVAVVTIRHVLSLGRLHDWVTIKPDGFW